MSQQNDTGFLSIAAGAARSAFLRVYNSSGTWTTAGASNQSAGVQLQPSLAATDQVAIKSCTGPGTLKMTASGIIAVGGDVYAGATGKVAATGTIIEGVALEAAAADGDIIEVLPVHNRDVAAAITGTTSATFEVDSDAATPKIALAGQTAGTGDFTTTLKPEAALAGNTYVILPETADGDTLVSLAATQTLTNKTLTAPAVTGAITGATITKIVPFIENASNTIHTGTVPIPAGAILLNIQVVNTVLWGATSASLIVGDDDDDNGFLAATNCKATDLLVGEVFDISNAENWGGKNGDYLVAATGRKGGVDTGNSGIYYAASNNIIGIMTVGTPAATTGRTIMAVTYCVPETIAAVATGP